QEVEVGEAVEATARLARERVGHQRVAGRAPEYGIAERIVDADRIVIAPVDDALADQAVDRLLDLDVVVVDRDGQARDEARLQNGTDGPALAHFGLEVGIAAADARNAGRGTVDPGDGAS